MSIDSANGKTLLPGVDEYASDLARVADVPRVTSLRDAAAKMHAAGLCVVPARQDGTKRPDVVSWLQYQTTRSTPADHEQWFGDGRATGIGVVYGAVSGNVEMIEFEGRAVAEGVFAEVNDLMDASGLGEAWQAILTGWADESPSGGVHYRVRVTDAPVPGNTKLANRLAREDEYTPEEIQQKAENPNKDISRGLIETRGEGGFGVTAPSHGTVHPSGKPYVRICGGPDTIPTLPADVVAAVHNALKMLDRAPKPEKASVPVTRQPADGSLRPGDDYEAKTDWADILEPDGWTLVYERGTRYWRRPGKGIGVSATTGHARDRDRLYVFTTSTEFEAGKPYTKFGAYALLHHGGDHKAAAAELSRQGYGTQREKKAKKSDSSGGALTDAFMADTVAEDVLKDRFAWTRGAGWLKWDGRKWGRCDVSEAVDAVRLYVIDRFKGALDGLRNEDASVNPKDLEGWQELLKATRLRAVTGLAQAIVAVDDAVLDADPDLLNALNGVVDLRTGELSGHDPALMMTRLAGAEYVPSVAPGAWDKVLEAIPEGMRDYLQTRAGQAATGHRAPDDVVPLLSGGGENGKSTWAAGLAGALGSYHVLVPDALLLGSRQRDESMTLRGARFALIEETPEGGHLDSTMLKKITSPEMSGHHLYQSETTWQTTHSLFITTNYKPVVTETDHGTWRRLELHEFPYRFTSAPEHPDDRQGDPTLRNRVEAGDPVILSAALAWIVDGAMRWYGKDKVMPDRPDAVRDATRAWREETDLILAYWGERLEPDPQAHVMSADLLADFNEWAAVRGQRPMSDRGFGPKFESHGETRTARAAKGNIRKTVPGLSRPAVESFTSVTSGNNPWQTGSGIKAVTAVPDRYRGWSGVRFRNAQ